MIVNPSVYLSVILWEGILRIAQLFLTRRARGHAFRAIALLLLITIGGISLLTFLLNI